jgi:hypothetical protein
MPQDKPNFALLIGKKKDDGPEKVDHASDLGVKDSMDKEGVENSAVKELFPHMDVMTAKQALKDFLEACYPNLAEEGSESSDDESAEQESEPKEY